MSEIKSAPEIAILQVIKKINEFWIKKEYAGIGEHLAEDVVIAPPGSEKRIHGRSAYVQSYRDYDQSANTLEFSPGVPQIDVMRDTGVAICPFYVIYVLEGKEYKEKGREILVFSKTAGEWKVVWRTMQTEPAE